jgi:RNA polymerase sigma factor (sigma-70 family)
MSIRSEKRGNSSDEGFEPADVKATQPETTVCRQEDAHRIMDAFRQLSFQEQAAVKAVYFDDLDTKEAAERLGMRHGTLRSHISRAIAKLQTKMNLIE